MTPYSLRQRIHTYHQQPNYFTEQQVVELKEYAKHYGIPFDDTDEALEQRHRTAKAYKESGVFSQLTSGFTEGVLGPLAVGGWAEDPVDEAQSIAYSVGHLFGFALPLAGSVLTMGGTGLARLGLAGAGRAVSSAGHAIRSGSTIAKVGKYKVPLKSIPLAAGDIAEEKAKEFLAKSGWAAAKYMGTDTLKGKAIDIGFQAGHLAVASAVSGIFNGQDDEMDNFLFGAVAGGWFGGLGNFINIGKMARHPNPKIAQAGKGKLWEWSDKLAKGIAGSAFQGGLATLHGAPTATQLYEYALGGFFGYQARGVVQKEASDYFNSFSKKDSADAQKNMLHGERFDKLPEESKILVKEAYTNHFGAMFKDSTNLISDQGEISEPALMFAHRIQPAFESAKERVAENYRKKVEDLEPHEIAEAQADTLDIVSRQHLAEVGSRVIVEKLSESIIKGEDLSKESKKMIEGLTDKEIEDVKSGAVDPLERAVTEYFEKRPHEEIITTAQDIIEAETKVLADQPEVSSAPMIGRFLNQVQDATINTTHNPKEVLNAIVEYYNSMSTKGAPVDDLVRDFTTAITNRFPEIHVTPEMKGGLVQIFTRLSQNELRPMISHNATTNETGTIWGFNWLRKKKVISEPASSDEVINREKGLWSDKIQVREFGEGVKSEFGVYYEFKPWDTKLNDTTKQYEPEMKPSDWKSVMKWLWTKRGTTERTQTKTVF